MTAVKKITIEEYLEKISRKVDDSYGKQFRSQFQDNNGLSELAILQCPTKEEFAELQKGVAIMTPAEKANVGGLSDEQVEKIAEDAKIDQANFAIFINGYVLFCKRVS